MRYDSKSGSAFFTELRQEVDRHFAAKGGNRLATRGLWLKACGIGAWTIGCYALLVLAAASFLASRSISSSNSLG